MSGGVDTVLVAAVLVAAAAPAQQRAFVRVETDRAEVWVGEAVRVRIVAGVERQFLTGHAVQLFRRELDLPVQVVAPWFDGGPGLRRVDAAARPADAAAPTAPTTSTLAVNEDVADAARMQDERAGGLAFAVAAVERMLCPESPGELELAAPQLRFASATAFRGDFVNGRVPVDRRDDSVSGEPTVLRVRALPTAGRPADFTGAVGTFSLQAEATPRELAVGERLQLVLTVRGDGDLGAWPPPRLDLPGFHEYGVLDGGAAGRARTLRYELAPVDVVAALPRVGFSFFAPADGGYRTAWAEPMPLSVRPSAGVPPDAVPIARGNGPSAPSATELADIKPLAALPRDRTPPGHALVLTVLLAPWLLATVVVLWRRGGDRTARPARASAAERLAAFAAAAERRDADLVRHLDGYLEARLGGSASAEDLGERLQRVGVPAELAQRTARLRQSLIAARYAGISAGAAVAAHDVVVQLERALLAAEARA